MCNTVSFLLVTLICTIVHVSVSGLEQKKANYLASHDKLWDSLTKDVPGRSRRSLPFIPASMSISSPIGRQYLDKSSSHVPASDSLGELSDNLIYGINGDSHMTTNQGNHKPLFTNCSNYQPRIREEEPPGIFVFKVTASDRDPPENGGKITYTFLSAPNDRHRFRIDSETGEIRTRHTFDRDEPASEKEMYLTVRATDNGSPQLDDVCTFKVVIEDINDNMPVFDKSSYKASVPQNLLPGSTIMRILATDIDEDKNSLVYYDFEPMSLDDAKYFHVERRTGNVILDKPLDKNPGHHFEIRVTATDEGEVPQLSFMDVEISVVESYNIAPAFKFIPASPIHLKESLSDFSYNIASLTASSNTDEKAPVFELVTGRTEQTNKLKTFRLESEGEHAYIRLGELLDYETISEYTLTIKIRNKYSLESETTIVIQIDDVNDNIPTFTELVSGSVLENEPPGTYVMQVRAIDEDGSSQHNQVTYELADNKEYFTIEPHTGIVTTLVTFDSKIQSFYNVKVYATDSSPSSLFETDKPNRGQQVFMIEIVENKGHSHRFTQTRHVRDADLNTVLTDDVDNDADVPNRSRHLQSGHSLTRFRHSRHLMDRRPTHESLLGGLFDPSGSSSNGLNGDFHMTPNNDNHKPVFTNCSKYQPSVKEEEPSGIYVFKVTATDRDPPENGGKITYAFVSAPNDRPKFSIDAETGEIRTRHTFDRDEPAREKEMYLTVRATDNGSPQLDDVCTFKVIIEDINDNMPVFDKSSYVESVPQDLSPGNNVMRISATDIDDGNNSLVYYDLDSKSLEDAKYFHIEKKTGFIVLDKAIDKDPGHHFRMRVTATDQGEVPQLSFMDLEISVVESHKKAPTFKYIPASPILLKENLSDFSYNIASLIAASNTDEKAPVFELVTGRTEQTNKLNTFRLESEGEHAYIRLGKLLDYEAISEYTLTIRIRNKYSLAAETAITIQVEDVNDNIPTFTEVVSGSVLENEPPGTPVMQVRAIDTDSSSQHNQVTYELADNKEFFTIDPYTGNITTLVIFDREVQDFYNVKVYATDNSPSALFGTNEPNRGQQVFRIEIADKNDHPPKFTKENYFADSVAEDSNINALVAGVLAEDKDTASQVEYSIVDGNIGEAFLIEPKTGQIRVNSPLDYENITSYKLKVRAFDGIYEDYANVDITIGNVNDNPPKFLDFKNNITIMEEQLQPGCIVTLKAIDPDIPNPNEDQHILYRVVPKQEQHTYLTIDKNGCLSLLKPLDRDPPKGFEIWQVLIQAIDEDGNSPTSQLSTAVVSIFLSDINDNAPFLDMKGPVIWRENQEPGDIATLTAKDNDGPENGAPFTFSISNSASSEIKSKFGVNGNQLTALTTFDREEKKRYEVQIAISDSGIPSMTGTSTLTVVIGDVNDNPMKSGSSDIFVYNYKGEAPDTEIGRVYVEDPDDWDLPDKEFWWADGQAHKQFELNSNTGMITMVSGTKGGSHLLHFEVSEKSPFFKPHKVEAVVNVTVKEIPEEAVDKSGSIRFSGISAEEFISPDSHGISKKKILQVRLANILNTSEDNVDVFTVLHSPHNTNQTQLDVRFSAHGSPYYFPERMNAAITDHRNELERALGVKMLMVGINECLVEKLYCESSCINFLNKSNDPSAVYTNTTSFVGVRAVVDPLCICEQPQLVCYNGGTPVGDTCECVGGYDGPHCEIASIGFFGDGWALYPPLSTCANSHLSLELRANKPNGLVFYVGPTTSDALRLLGVQDFMSLELLNGYPILLVDFGSGTVRLEHKHVKLSDGEMHRIDISWSNTTIQLQVDDCKLSTCLTLTTPQPPNEYLNVNGPLQLGGTHMKLGAVAEGMNWSHLPHDEGFSGCIRNLTFNGKLYNLGEPSHFKNADKGCNLAGMAVAATIGIDTSFLVAILICLAILLILLLAVVVHRKKTDDLYKDTDDIRENIINYEDEGGGEGDMTGYDLNVLRLMYDDPLNEKQVPNGSHLIPRPGPDEVPDICGFLDGKKHSVDNDPETNPFDDVRHYAYEGDGNTTGSLSSLASGTDEGDLNFDYLSNFGPRFRKLADMYGEDPSDEEDDNFHNTASESWC